MTRTCCGEPRALRRTHPASGKARSRWKYAVAIFTIIVVAASCGSDSEPSGDTITEGTISSIDATGTGFTLCTSDGLVSIVLQADRDYGFDLAHLQVHLDGGLPVRVTGSSAESGVVALEIADSANDIQVCVEEG